MRKQIHLWRDCFFLDLYRLTGWIWVWDKYFWSRLRWLRKYYPEVLAPLNLAETDEEPFR